MLTQREQVDILYDNHLPVILPEQCRPQYLFGVLVITPCQVLHRFGYTVGRLDQPITGYVFTQQRDHLFHVIRYD